ncbi:MAG: 2-amino-4-hydroxy-6-hydroxymethyldihydropteridine diphosphokinase [Myxococcales bacterium]
MPQAVLGFGSNLGARRALLRCALELLAGQPGLRVVARSQLYETPPLGPPQPDYLNAAARIAWCGGLEGLFQVTQQVEILLGRERRERWGARTLDIDILHWSEGPVHTPRLQVPHAELVHRSFALAPLLEVWPELAPSYARVLDQLGGPPARANPGWLELTPAQGGLCTELAPDLPADEIACLAVSAVGGCARMRQTARASLAFESPRAPLEGRSSFLLGYVESLRRHGFLACDAAITHSDARGTRGFVIGEHVGTAPVRATVRVELVSEHGLARTLRAFPPIDP